MTNTFGLEEMNFTQLTSIMQVLEERINRAQRYIAKHGAANDLDSDSAWESYKRDADEDLMMWDTAKVFRDRLKAA